MSEFLHGLRERIKTRPETRVLFPEPQDSRVLNAALELKREGLAVPILVHGPQDSRPENSETLNFVEIQNERAGELKQLLLELRAKKGLSDAEAEQLSRDPLLYGMYLLRLGEADALVGGVTRPSADVIRAGLWLVGMKEGTRTVSSSFYMLVPPFRSESNGREEVLTFADCGVVPEPTAEQLADIAIAAADTRALVVGDKPKVAFLSYSTKGSGGSDAPVLHVREALRIMREKRPDILADGELQGDAALITDIGQRKSPESSVAGQANVLVFPTLDAANIAYKLVERLIPGAQALGPILHGFKTPVSDLSRGANIEDIKNVAIITALQVLKR